MLFNFSKNVINNYLLVGSKRNYDQFNIHNSNYVLSHLFNFWSNLWTFLYSIEKHKTDCINNTVNLHATKLNPDLMNQ